MTLSTERMAIGNPKTQIGIAIITPEVINRLIPNIERSICLLFKANMRLFVHCWYGKFY